MKKLREYEIETANARFVLTLYEDSGNHPFVGKYSGNSPKFAQKVRPGEKVPMMKDIDDGTIEGATLDEVEKKCLAEIEKLDGEIQKKISRKV